MKEKTKKGLETIIDMIGYGMGLSLSLNMANILIGVLKHGSSVVIHSTGTPLLLAEIGITAGSTIFFIYKFIKNMKDREKLYK